MVMIGGGLGVLGSVLDFRRFSYRKVCGGCFFGILISYADAPILALPRMDGGWF